MRNKFIHLNKSSVADWRWVYSRLHLQDADFRQSALVTLLAVVWFISSTIWRSCIKFPVRQYICHARRVKITVCNLIIHHHSCMIMVVVVVVFFSLCCENFVRMFYHSFPACTLFFFFFKVEINSCTLISLFMPGSVHSGPVSWLWPTVPWEVACQLISR